MNMPRETEPSKTKQNIWYFESPFIGKLSKVTQDKLEKLTKNFCNKSPNFKVLVNTFKLVSLFSTKYKLPYDL